MARESVLVVDDERDILELLAYNLGREGYCVTCVGTGEEALRVAAADSPDQVVLDLMLPGVDGLEVCRTLKSAAATRSIPVVMLTAKGGEADIVAGLELGADDYIAKPFSPRVLVARVRAVLRRLSAAPVGDDEVMRLGEITIHPGRHEVMVGGAAVELTVSEFRILHALGRRPGWVFTRRQLVEAAQGDDMYVNERFVTERSIDVHIVSLRRKLGPADRAIDTVRGVGYRLKAD